ncbi:Phage protein [Bacillus cereus]|nr:Phage protein [Bacillus cereus]
MNQPYRHVNEKEIRPFVIEELAAKYDVFVKVYVIEEI